MKFESAPRGKERSNKIATTTADTERLRKELKQGTAVTKRDLGGHQRGAAAQRRDAARRAGRKQR